MTLLLLLILGIISPNSASIVKQLQPNDLGQLQDEATSIENIATAGEDVLDRFKTELQNLNVWRHVSVAEPIDTRLDAVLTTIIDQGCTFMTTSSDPQHQILCGSLMEYQTILTAYKDVKASTANLTEAEVQETTRQLRMFLHKEAPIFTGEIKVSVVAFVAQLIFAIRHTFLLPDGLQLSPAFDFVDALTASAISEPEVPIGQLIKESRFFTDVLLIDDNSTWTEYPDLFTVRDHLTFTTSHLNASAPMYPFVTSHSDAEIHTTAWSDSNDLNDYSSNHLSRVKRSRYPSYKTGGGRNKNGRPGSGHSGSTGGAKNIGRGFTFKARAQLQHSHNYKQQSNVQSAHLQKELNAIHSTKAKQPVTDADASTSSQGAKARTAIQQAKGVALDNSGRQTLASQSGDGAAPLASGSSKSQPTFSQKEITLARQEEAHAVQLAKSKNFFNRYFLILNNNEKNVFNH